MLPLLCSSSACPPLPLVSAGSFLPEFARYLLVGGMLAVVLAWVLVFAVVIGRAVRLARQGVSH